MDDDPDMAPAAKKRKISGNLKDAIDEGLYSRQLYVLGHDAMRKISHSDVLISGMGGLGVEIAKNIILAGVKSVTLHDEQVCRNSDLASQFYLKIEDLGRNRAESCSKRLGELNDYVEVYVYTAPLTPEFIKEFKVVVLTSSTLQEQKKVSDITRKNNIALIVADSKGLFGQVFCDFGEDFTVSDCTGESPISATVVGVSKEAEGVVSCLDDSRHGFEDGDLVTFAEVKGMEQLNGCKAKEVKVLGPYTFSIGDTRNYSDYIAGGIVTQVKKQKKLHFKSLRDSINEPEFVITDFAKAGNATQLHLAFQAFHEFISTGHVCPGPWNQRHAEEFVKFAKKLNDNNKFKVAQINESLLEVFAKTSSGNLCPMNAVIGGIVGQEVIKATSGKFNPIYQWLYFDAIECLPQDTPDLAEKDCKPENCRYDSQIAVFGKIFQEKLRDMKYFVVGAGAIGCELLKNFSMMGVGAGTGYLKVADMDIIERSNLNRQFLFRPCHVGKFKSHVAAEAAKEMNPDLQIQPFIKKVDSTTEELYDEEFFKKLDGVANALDSYEARLYVDQRCVYFKKPLLDSGTLGTKGNVQVIVPFLTESYESSTDPPEKSVPLCTLRHFPNSIDHTLAWARDMFEGIFRQTYETTAKYISDPQGFDKIRKLGDKAHNEAMLSVRRVLKDERPFSYMECVVWARNQWEEQFNNQIRQLLFNFPPDYLTPTGQPFWSGTKRCPHPLAFSANVPAHLDYVIAAANLRAQIYGIPRIKDRSEVAQIAKNVKIPQFIPKTGVTIQVIDGEAAQADARDDQVDKGQMEKLRNDLIHLKRNMGRLTIKPIVFDKDDDTNFHMDFITSASNLRAENYNIPPADKFKSKLIAGKIIPAIATTTSVVAGLACLEFYKLAQGFKTLSSYKNGFLNLALPFIGFSEPVAANKGNYLGKEWTLWDQFEVQGEMTLRQFLEHFKNEHNLNIEMITQGTLILHNQPREDRMDLTLSQLVKIISGEDIKPHVQALFLDLSCSDDDNNDVQVPRVRYVLPPKEQNHFAL